MAEIERISVTGRPAPAGHYSAAVAHDGLVFVSGQLPSLADGSHALAGAAFETQAKTVLDNLFAVLAAAGSGPERVLKVTVFITDMADWPAFNIVYAEAFGDHRPARSVVPVGPLHHGYKIEVEAIAVRA